MTVYAVDFADGMLERARLRVEDSKNVRFVQAAFTNLQAMPEPVDVAVSVNSLVLPNPDEHGSVARRDRAAA